MIRNLMHRLAGHRSAKRIVLHEVCPLRRKRCVLLRVGATQETDLGLIWDDRRELPDSLQMLPMIYALLLKSGFTNASCDTSNGWGGHILCV